MTNTPTNPRTCEACLQPAGPDDSFTLQPFALYHAVDAQLQKTLTTRWDKAGLPATTTAHTACVPHPELLDWPANTPFQSWATARISQLSSLLAPADQK